MMGVVKLRVDDHSEADPVWVVRARQYSRVVGWRSTSGVYEVVPAVPSGTPPFRAMMAKVVNAVELEVEKSLRSDTWNS
jgi:hypothetical protein